MDPFPFPELSIFPSPGQTFICLAGEREERSSWKGEKRKACHVISILCFNGGIEITWGPMNQLYEPKERLKQKKKPDSWFMGRHIPFIILPSAALSP